MDIRKYLGKRTQKEQSDKSSGEESDTEESLCPADKSKTFMTCPVSNKLSAQQKKCYKKKVSYKKVWEKVETDFLLLTQLCHSGNLEQYFPVYAM